MKTEKVIPGGEWTRRRPLPSAPLLHEGRDSLSEERDTYSRRLLAFGLVVRVHLQSRERDGKGNKRREEILRRRLFRPNSLPPGPSPKSRDCDSETMREKRGGKRHFSPENRDCERTETDGRV